MTIVQATNHTAVDPVTTPTVKHWIDGVQTEGTTGRSEPLIAELKMEAENLKVGPGSAQDTDIGPVITPAARQRVLEFTTSVIGAGAAAIVDGRDVTVTGDENGFFLGPTILDNVSTDMAACDDEVFGPKTDDHAGRGCDEALALVNSSPLGNGFSIFTRSGGVARRFEVEAGMVGINVPIPVPMGASRSVAGRTHYSPTTTPTVPRACALYSRAMVVTTRWPHEETLPGPSVNFPGTN